MRKTKRVNPNLYRQTGEGQDNWFYRYGRKGKSVWLGLGSVRGVSVKEARAGRDRLNAMREKERIDPLSARRAGKAKRAVPTFREAAEKYLADILSAFRNPAHRQQWRNTMASTYGRIGNILISDVEPAHIASVLSRSWGETPETARRLRDRIERILEPCPGNRLRP